MFLYNKKQEKYENKKIIYGIIKWNSNHRDIITSGSGASELLFFMTLFKLSKFYNVIIYYDGPDEIIDNITYKNLSDIKIIKTINSSVIIIQRDFGLLKSLHKLNNTNKYILWGHDYIDHYDDTIKYIEENNIPTVFVSKFQQNKCLEVYPKINKYVIYNALFPDLYEIDTNIKYDKNKIIFASAWWKGLTNILKIGSEYHKLNKDFRLILIKPSYSQDHNDFKEYPFIEYKGNIKDKKEYSKLFQSCLCVFSTSFPETFGCIYAEALHLGVPVIGDLSVNSAIREIIKPEHMCDYNNIEQVIKIIEQFRNNRPKVSLDKKFYEKDIINKWHDLIESF